MYFIFAMENLQFVNGDAAIKYSIVVTNNVTMEILPKSMGVRTHAKYNNIGNALPIQLAKFQYVTMSLIVGMGY
jgi:hypothetical protein